MTEVVKVFRGTDATDADGNSIHGTLSPWKSFRANVAPTNLDEAVEVGRAAAIDGFTVYIPAKAPTGIRPSDLVEIRGTQYPIVGAIGQWVSKRGTYKGDQFAVKVVTG